jgi:IS1 family transposase
MRIPLGTAEAIIAALCEGASASATARLTRTDVHTVIDLMIVVGQRCARYMESELRGVCVGAVQIDEIWQFIGAKERTVKEKNLGPEYGDSYTFVATEATSKMVLCYHFGRRDQANTDLFASKLRDATAGRFQLSSDAWQPYRTSMPDYIGDRIDFGMIVKIFGAPSRDEQRHYSPPKIKGMRKEVVYGNPKQKTISTSYIERLNGSIRCFVKRMGRLTYCFSKRWENHGAMLGLFFMHYNFCRKHKTLKYQTPAMATGLASHPWTIRELLTAVATQ